MCNLCNGTYIARRAQGFGLCTVGPCSSCGPVPEEVRLERAKEEAVLMERLREAEERFGDSGEENESSNYIKKAI